ncbi:uncharacterized protein [Diabrotica undecimpunctata]|uniref:uncharacterized protein n=1 Tax=Diabrotica undecimpunctata TaxID=50387 RepID=UPI003B639DE2
MGPQLVPIENIYDSNNIPDVIYQGDISNCEEDSVSAIPLSSIEEIASTSTCSVLPNIMRDNVSTPKQKGIGQQLILPLLIVSKSKLITVVTMSLLFFKFVLG